MSDRIDYKAFVNTCDCKQPVTSVSQLIFGPNSSGTDLFLNNKYINSSGISNAADTASSPGTACLFVLFVSLLNV